MTLREPTGKETCFDSYPTHKLKIKGYCKYCYTTHKDWWQMDRSDYDADVVLCGKCGYTIKREFT
jgi:hypothetical protein